MEAAAKARDEERAKWRLEWDSQDGCHVLKRGSGALSVAYDFKTSDGADVELNRICDNAFLTAYHASLEAQGLQKPSHFDEEGEDWIAETIPGLDNAPWVNCIIIKTGDA